MVRSLPFDWENATDDVAGQSSTQTELVHPEIPAEIPGVILESDLSDDTANDVSDTENLENLVTRARRARENAALPAKITGVPRVSKHVSETINIESDDDDSDAESECPSIEDHFDSSDSEDEDEEDIEDVIENIERTNGLIEAELDVIESVNGEDIEDIQRENDPVWLAENRPDEYGRGKRERTQANEAYLPGQMTGPNGQTYAQGTNNLGWAKLQYRGYKYKMREGVIQLNLGDVDNRPSGLDEEEVIEHILGVILIHQYNLKRAWNYLVKRVS